MQPQNPYSGQPGSQSHPQPQPGAQPYAQPQPIPQPVPQQPLPQAPQSPFQTAAGTSAGQTSQDYLNKIAAKPPKSGGLFSGSFLWIVIGAAVLLLGAVGFMSMGGNGNTPRADSEVLYMRLSNLRTIADENQQFLRSSSLRGTNTVFMTLLTDILTNQLGPQLNNMGVRIDRPSDRAVAQETEILEDITARMDEARLHVRLDRAYAQEMSFQIELVQIIIERVSRTASADYKGILERIGENLETSRVNFSRFTE